MRPLILLCNDDGIFSPGLHALANAVAHLGDLLIAAPHEQQTAMGRSKPRKYDSGIIESVEVEVSGKPHPAYAIRCSPALTVAHAITELAARPVDLCLSGINYGENVGFSLTASGTIGAALEAASFGIPALALSLETPLEINFLHDYAPLQWDAAMHFAAIFAEQTLRDGLPDGVALFNINIPNDATPATPTRMTIQSRSNYYNLHGTPNRSLHEPHILHETKGSPAAELEPNSDVMAVAYDRVVSFTPMSGLLTAHHVMITQE
jgi:5'-nucleotidase